MTPNKKPRETASSISEVVALIERAERHLLSVLENLPRDGEVAQCNEILQHLALARLKLEVPGLTDNRTTPRVHERSMACLREFAPGAPAIEAEVYDMSAGGALICCEAPLTDGGRYKIEVDGLAEPVAGRIHAAQPNLFHVVFEGLAAERKLELTKHLERHYFRF